MREELLEAFQICDSTFPIGTFNHSFGMENYLSRRVIRDGKGFYEWLKSYYRSQFCYGEGLLVLLCYQALDEDQPERLLALDDLITKSTIAEETREGTCMIASQMIALLKKIYGTSIPALNVYADSVENGAAWGNPAIPFSIFAHSRDIEKKDAFWLYGYSIASTMVQNAVRSIPLGQREGQVILHKMIDEIKGLYKKAQTLDESYLGANAPGLELAQIGHQTQPARLFMS